MIRQQAIIAGGAMQDMLAQLEKLRRDAAECELIARVCGRKSHAREREKGIASRAALGSTR
jgi:hypothetical protein